MSSLSFDKRHIRDYLFSGILAAAAYTAPLVFLLYNRWYENLYFLFFGNFLFMLVIGIYAGILRNREFEKRKSVSMLISGHLATAAGVILSVIFSIVTIYSLSPAVFHPVFSTDDMVQDRLPELMDGYKHLSWMVVINALVGNTVVGSFISLMISYSTKNRE